jgi:hypothetical protein
VAQTKTHPWSASSRRHFDRSSICQYVCIYFIIIISSLLIFDAENPAQLLLDARKLGNVFTVDLSLLRMTMSFRNEDIQHFFKAQESEMTLQCMDTSRSILKYLLINNI